MQSRESAFRSWMRTGRQSLPPEFKFNPWHDPDDGRFTFSGQGRYFGHGGEASSQGTARMRAKPKEPSPSRPAAIRRLAKAEAAMAAERARIVRERQEREAFKQYMVPGEGNRNDVYPDSRGIPTVGIGHKVLPKDGLKLGDHISDAQKEAFWRKDSKTALDAAKQQMLDAKIAEPDFLPALASVNYQLGPGWTGKFPKAWSLIKSRRYSDAAIEVEDSAWFQLQTRERARAFRDALLLLEQAERAKRKLRP